MVKIKVRGHEFEAVVVRDSFSRRAVQFQNKIIANFKKLGLSVDDVDIKLEPNSVKKVPASVSWYMDGRHLHYSNNSMGKYVENLYVVFKIIDIAIIALLEERISLEDFISEFSEDVDVAKKRRDARVVLGLDHEVNNLEVIDKAYKDLAKKHHPDVGSGNVEKFKEINRAHKILKRELM